MRQQEKDDTKNKDKRIDSISDEDVEVEERREETREERRSHQENESASEGRGRRRRGHTHEAASVPCDFNLLLHLLHHTVFISRSHKISFSFFTLSTDSYFSSPMTLMFHAFIFLFQVPPPSSRKMIKSIPRVKWKLFSLQEPFLSGLLFMFDSHASLVLSQVLFLYFFIFPLLLLGMKGTAGTEKKVDISYPCMVDLI